MDSRERRDSMAQLSNALRRIERELLSTDWQQTPAAYGVQQSWNVDNWSALGEFEREAKEAAREIYRALARGAPLPEVIDRARLMHVCQTIHRVDDIDTAEVRETVHQADLVLTDPRRSQTCETYCHAMMREGKQPLTKEEYEGFVRQRDEYDLFIDGITGEATKFEAGEIRASKLTPLERDILIEYIANKKPMRPYRTTAGSKCSSPSSAVRLLQGARKKVDEKVGRNDFRSIHVRKSHGDNAYEFKPPEDLDYCVIVSA